MSYEAKQLEKAMKKWQKENQEKDKNDRSENRDRKLGETDPILDRAIIDIMSTNFNTDI